MKTVPTFTATVYVSLEETYSADGVKLQVPIVHSLWDVQSVLRDYCDIVGLCVTLSETQYIFTHGSERGIVVGLINYPRFPSTPEAIRGHAMELAARLKVALGQRRVSVVFPDETVMLGEKNP
jgi:hypothetical protein